MVGDFGVPATISYEVSTLTNTDTSDDNWFKEENGVLIVQKSNAMIGREVTVTPKVQFGSIEIKAPSYKK